MDRTSKPASAASVVALCAAAWAFCASAGAEAASAETAHFAFTGGEQTFTVPAGVSQVRVVAVRGRGGGPAGLGGFGAVASATLP